LGWNSSDCWVAMQLCGYGKSRDVVRLPENLAFPRQRITLSMLGCFARNTLGSHVATVESPTCECTRTIDTRRVIPYIGESGIRELNAADFVWGLGSIRRREKSMGHSVYSDWRWAHRYGLLN
jgi:hypothetical protein